MPSSKRAYPEAGHWPVVSSVAPLGKDLAELELVDEHGRRSQVAILRDAYAFLPGATLSDALQGVLSARLPYVAPADRHLHPGTLVSG